MKYVYTPKGVCSQKIEIELNGSKIDYVKFFGGCNGNLKGICNLIAGENAKDVIKKLRGIKCGNKPTSCPDQLADALEYALNNKKM